MTISIDKSIEKEKEGTTIQEQTRKMTLITILIGKPTEMNR
jgi:hypothetical protein